MKRGIKIAGILLLALGLLGYGQLLTPVYAEKKTPADPITHQEIHIHYDYNSSGVLIGQSGTQTITGKDLQGNDFTTIIKLTYEVINGKSVLKESKTTTDATNADGSESHSETTTTYTYDADGTLIGASGTTSSHGYDKDQAEIVDEDGDGIQDVDDDGNPLYWKDADHTETTTDADEANQVRGDYFETDTTLTYAIMGGQAVVVKSDSTTKKWDNEEDSKDDKGNETTPNKSESTSTTVYTYKLINGSYRRMTAETTTHTTDYTQSYLDADENTQYGFSDKSVTVSYTYNDKGALTGASGTGSSAGVEGNPKTGTMQAFTGDITETYTIKAGVAFMSNYDEDKDYASLDPAPAKVDPHVEGTVVSKFTATGTKEYTHGSFKKTQDVKEYFVIVKDKDGKLWIIKLNHDVGNVSPGKSNQDSYEDGVDATNADSDKAKEEYDSLSIGDTVAFDGDVATTGSRILENVTW